MIKSIRKYNRWFMAGFGVLLMVAWLVGPSMQKIGEMRMNKKIASLDGRGISYADQMHAGREVQMLSTLYPGAFGIEDRDTTHWTLLVHEAEAAGLVGEGEAGRDFTEQLAQAIVDRELQRDWNTMMQVRFSKDGPELYKRMIDGAKEAIPRICRQNGLNEADTDRLMARSSGILRLLTSYRTAARVSDRLAAMEARNSRDAAVADYVFIPASLGVDQIPEPDEAALKAHFEKYKNVKPGEGEYGIGYKFPPRVKLEWMKLDRAAFEIAVPIDPVEVNKRWRANRSKYPGEIAAEREKVEKDMRAEGADKAMQEAQLAVHAEILKALKGVETQGKYRVLPPDWAQKRPKLETLAQAVVEQAKLSKLNIPLPEITVRAGEWATLSELSALPGIGQATVQHGGAALSLADLVSWTKDFPGSPGESAPIAVQPGLTLAEQPLADAEGNRYFVTVLETHPESPPDTLDEKREQIVKDWKLIQSFERLKGRAEEFRQMAVAQGLDAVAKAVSPPEPPAAPDGTKPAAKDKVEVRKQASINREAGGGDPNLNDPELRKALLEAAQKLDPLIPFGSAPAEQATVAIPTPKRLGVAVFRIQANTPLTREVYRAVDQQIVMQTQQKELQAQDSPFSLTNLLKRHVYISGEKRVTSPDDLKKERGEG